MNRLHTLTDIGIQTKKFGTTIKNTIGNTVDIARTEGLKRLNQVKEFSVARAKGLGRKLEKDIIEVARLADHGIMAGKRVGEAFSNRRQLAVDGVPGGFGKVV